MDTPNIGDWVETLEGFIGTLKCKHESSLYSHYRIKPYYCVAMRFTNGAGCDQAWMTDGVTLLERNSSKNHLTKPFMSNLLSRFKALTVREPSKTYQQLGIEHEDGRLTDEGMRLVVQEWHEAMNKTNSAFHNKCKKLLEEKS